MSTHEHLEHAEHAQHAAHDPFDKRVALTIAVIAAVLATVTLLSHQAHNETLRLQIEAGINQTKATDTWNQFQANNIRRHEYQADARLIDVVAKAPDKEAQAIATREDWDKKVNEYAGKLDQLQGEAKSFEAQADQNRNRSHYTHQMGTRFDLGELAVELGLVLCSIAILTKRRDFWYAGIVSAVLGALAAATVLFLSPHAEGHDGPATHQQAPETTHGH
jgi:Domain of unknown function (DUF4337)